MNSQSLPDKNPTLGVVTISYNEECDLPGFLTNLIDWVDEIIIIDDGSSDSTSELARSAGSKVKFIQSPRKEGEYFSHQRNKGIDAAKSDWLLHMDVDERVTPKLAKEILAAITSKTHVGYKYRRLNYFMHRPMQGGGWQNWNLVHLAKRDKFRFGGMFHESCLVDARDDEIGQLVGKMVHFNEDNFEKRLRKSGTYMEEIIKHIEARDRPVNVFDLIARSGYEFIRRYILKKGFLDGTAGLISAIHTATATFRAYSVVWDRQNHVSRKELEIDIARQWEKDNAGIQNSARK